MNTARLRILALATGGALLFGAGQLSAPTAGAAGDAVAGSGTCSTEMLKGRYVLAGGGTLGGDFDVILNLVLDGKGAITEGVGTAVVHRLAAVENVTAKDGTYSVDESCSGKLRFFALHKTVGPYDHAHEADIMVFDGGRQFALINLTTELPGAPNAMTEAFLLRAHRV